MLYYIGRRVLTALPVLLGVMLVTFAMARMIPGVRRSIPLGLGHGKMAKHAPAHFAEEETKAS